MSQAGERVIEVLGAFLRLGLRSFGGPMAHFGYFRAEFVARRGWLDESAFARLLALCQFLPGPASSQLGFAIGLRRAGLAGAMAAWFAFTLPSALLMYAFARLAPVADGSWGAAVTHGLKLVAVAVVGAALFSMGRTLARGPARLAIAATAAAMVVALDAAWAQLAAIAWGAALGSLAFRGAVGPLGEASRAPVSHGLAWACGALYAAGLAAALWWSSAGTGDASLVALLASSWRAGALVFGGAHVVLPLLEHSMVDTGWIEPARFLAGYGAAQAVPGPMFSFAAYLGAVVPTGAPPPLASALATVAMFAPGLLLVVALAPAWQRLATLPRAAAAVAGIDAAVVGLLGAALVDPVWSQGVGDALDGVVALAGLAATVSGRVPALAVVAGGVAIGLLRAALGA